MAIEQEEWEETAEALDDLVVGIADVWYALKLAAGSQTCVVKSCTKSCGLQTGDHKGVCSAATCCEIH